MTSRSVRSTHLLRLIFELAGGVAANRGLQFLFALAGNPSENTEPYKRASRFVAAAIVEKP